MLSKIPNTPYLDTEVDDEDLEFDEIDELSDDEIKEGEFGELEDTGESEGDEEEPKYNEE